MTLSFTEDEKEWLVKEPLNWHCDENAPQSIKDSINAKLGLLKKEVEEYERITHKPHRQQRRS